MYNRASDTRLETAKAVATAMVADTSLPSSIKSYAVLPKAQMRPLLQHVQQNVPGLLRKYDRVKYTRASTSGRQHSAAVVACRPNAVPTVVASRGVAHGSSVPAQTSAAAVPQRNYTGTAVLPILKGRQWFRQNNKADASAHDLNQMSKQEWVQMSCRLEAWSMAMGSWIP
ncbi:TPA: hypothetical protein ACH3X1_009186 [Trebouxia sp. C0004]